MTDTERVDFIVQHKPDVGFVEGLYCVLVWGEVNHIPCVVASAHRQDLRDALDAAAERVRQKRAA